MTKSELDVCTATINRFKIGRFFLEHRHGGFCLLINANNIYTDFFDCGYIPKKHLAQLMRAFIHGFEWSRDLK